MDEEIKHQKEINQDLGNYMHERHKNNSLWHKVFAKKPKPKEVDENQIKHELEKVAGEAQIAPEDKKELEQMETKIEEVDKMEEEVEETFEQEREGLLKRFFKKLRSTKKTDAAEESGLGVDADEITPTDSGHAHAHESADDETRELLKRMHDWITQLPPEKLKEFKNSEDFQLYTKVLKKHNLIKQ